MPPTQSAPVRDTAPAQKGDRPAAGTAEWREALFKRARARAALGNDALNDWWDQQSGEAKVALEAINSELDAIVNETTSRRELRNEPAPHSTTHARKVLRVVQA